MFGGVTTKSGVNVSGDNALKVSVVLACARVIAEGVSQLPLKLYRDGADGTKQVASDHPVHRLIHRRPNDWQTSFEFRETVTMHAVLTGNGLALKVFAGGQLAELIPLLPSRVTASVDAFSRVSYVYCPDKGQPVTLRSDQVLRLRGPSWDGIFGLDIIKLAREAVGLAAATEEAHARLHGNGSQPGGILSTDSPLTKEQVDQVRDAWTRAQSGPDSKFKTAVLPLGFKFSPMAMKGVDTQHLETRRFQIEEICRAMRVFPLMVMQSDKASTFASAEQFFLAHVIHSLGPWIERWEQALDRDLLSDIEQSQGYYTNFSVAGLLRGAAADRSAFYGAGIKDGWLLRNEARSLEDLDKLPGLDVPLAPLNQATVNEAGELVLPRNPDKAAPSGDGA